MPVSDDLWQLLRRADWLSRESDGAFDVTVGPVTKLWRRSRRRGELPPADRLEAARAAVGYRFVELDAAQPAIRLSRPDMRLDFGGIAQGYAADEAIEVLRELGIRSALVNASGDIAAAESPPGTPGWKIGIAPLEPGGPPSRFLFLKDAAISTSGDAFQYVTIGGQRYSHIVDPRTGLGLTTRSSVSVIARDCTTADGLATALSVLGPDKGLALADRLPDVAALVVFVRDGETVTRASRRFEDLRRRANRKSAGQSGTAAVPDHERAYAIGRRHPAGRLHRHRHRHQTPVTFHQQFQRPRQRLDQIHQFIAAGEGPACNLVNAIARLQPGRFRRRAGDDLHDEDCARFGRILAPRNSHSDRGAGKSHLQGDEFRLSLLAPRRPSRDSTRPPARCGIEPRPGSPVR